MTKKKIDMADDWPRVAVMGGSIGGLTAALVLHELGCEVDVYERSKAPLRDRGAGIGLHPMTIRYFAEHDPLDSARVVLELPWLQFIDKKGRRTYQEKMNYRFSSWTTVYRTLLQNFQPQRYHLGAEVTRFSQDDDGVALRFADGATREADMLVCADGISSLARTVLQPQARANYAGYVAWRGTVAESELSAEAFACFRDSLTYCLLPAGHVLVYPIPGADGALQPGRRLANLVWYHNYAQGSELDDLMTDARGELRTISMPPGSVRPEHIKSMKDYARQHMPAQLSELFDKIVHPFVQVIFDIEIERMAFSRICLIGDGAFAVRPHAAAGTAKACADAWALRDALRESGGDVRSALAEWEPGQLELGRQLLTRTQRMGNGSQFEHNWVPGDPALRLGLYGPGN